MNKDEPKKDGPAPGDSSKNDDAKKNPGDSSKNVDAKKNPLTGDQSMKIERKPPTLMKGGILDRSPVSWITILVVTILWWAFMVGFTAACFTLMSFILYGSASPGEKDTMPYFVRNSAKYPAIFTQPGLGINCGHKNSKKNQTCAISINKMFLWKPEPYGPADSPSVKLADGRSHKLKESLGRLGHNNLAGKADTVYITCYGKKKADDKLLQGMKLDKPGVKSSLFPWTAKGNSSWSINLDLSGTKAATGKKEVSAKLDCRMWAKNVEKESQPGTVGYEPRGGLATTVYWDKKGKITAVGDKDKH